jgi:hypothetical protein
VPPTWRLSAANSLSYVEVAAESTKTNARGLQTVTIRLKIKPNQSIYAHDQPLLGMVPILKLAAATRDPKTKIDVIYPKGRDIGEAELRQSIHEGEIAIQVIVRRAAGDRSPLVGRVDFRAVGTVY